MPSKPTKRQMATARRQGVALVWRVMTTIDSEVFHRDLRTIGMSEQSVGAAIKMLLILSKLEADNGKWVSAEAIVSVAGKVGMAFYLSLIVNETRKSKKV